MSSIRILPPGLQNQIAAGEVVERPSSVVKELMENSLDAGSGNIQAYLESGGQRLIEVIDDGHGMKPDDLPLALTRHATSKISSIDELVCVSSFGFRGEALPSIASISQLTISSCPEGWDQGFFLKLIYGKMVEQGPVAMNPGTRIRVENLLANVPARLKFLKTRATESRKCTESFIRYCLAHLNVDFELFSESRSIYRFFQGQSLLDRLNIVWPAQVCESLKEFSGEQSGMSIHGLASDPKSTQPRADRLLFYINKRPVSDRMLLSAVRQAYKGRLLSREYPQAAVFIELPPDEVDINVHPAKNQVRFRDEKTVFSLVVRALKPVMGNDIYQSSYEETSTVENTGSHSSLSYTQQSEGQEKTFHRLKEKRSGFSYAGRAPAPPQNQIHQADKQSISIRGLVYLGQVQKSFLIFRKSDSTLIIVDQHAAHERIMLEKIQNGLKKTVVKRLALPERLVLNRSEMEHLQTVWKDISKMGFNLSADPEGTLVVSGIPDFMSPDEAHRSIKDILSQKKKNLDEMFAAMACRSSIKSGTSLTPDEAAGLMEKLLDCQNNRYCPHGRPVTIELGLNELEKMFKRK